jgi:hypothetical protein
MKSQSTAEGADRIAAANGLTYVSDAMPRSRRRSLRSTAQSVA